MANLAITLGDVLVNAKGGKFCPLKDAEGRPPTWTSDWLRIIWHPSAYGEPEARRVNLCVEPDDAAREHFEAVERKLAQELSKPRGTECWPFLPASGPAVGEASAPVGPV